MLSSFCSVFNVNVMTYERGHHKGCLIAIALVCREMLPIHISFMILKGFRITFRRDFQRAEPLLVMHK